MPSTSPTLSWRATSSSEVGQAVRPVLDPRDQADRQRNRDRIVRSRLCLEHPCEPTAQVRHAQRREDGGCVRRRNDGAEQEGRRPAERKDRVCDDTGDRRRDDDTDGAQHRRRDDDRPDRPPRGRDPALEEDDREPDDPDRARKMRVRELDAADPVAPEQHPDPEERDQHRHARLACDRRRGDAASRIAPTTRISVPGSTALESRGSRLDGDVHGAARRAPARSRARRRARRDRPGRPTASRPRSGSPSTRAGVDGRGGDRLFERRAERVQVADRLDHRQHAAGEHAVRAAHRALVHEDVEVAEAVLAVRHAGSR